MRVPLYGVLRKKLFGVGGHWAGYGKCKKSSLCSSNLPSSLLTQCIGHCQDLTVVDGSLLKLSNSWISLVNLGYSSENEEQKLLDKKGLP